MKIKLLLFFCLLFTTKSLTAQADFRPGFVIEQNGDTLFGQIDYRGDQIMGEKCRFRKNGKVQVFSPVDILAFRFEEGKFFESKDLKDKKAFLEFLIKGKANIYYYRDEQGDHYYLEKEGSEMIELPYREEIKHIGKKHFLFKSTGHQGILKHELKDAPGLESSINAIEKPGHKNLIALAKSYHYEVCEDEECIVFEKNLTLISFAFGVHAGVVKMNEVYYEEGETYDGRQLGLNLYVSLPRTNENLFLKLSYQNNRSEEITSNSGCLMLEYRYQRYKLQPLVGYGVGLNIREIDGGFFARVNLGLQYDLGSLYLQLNGHLDTFSKYMIPSREWFNYGVHLGVGTNL